jgi:transposase
MTKDGWAKIPMDRNQLVMFSPSLDAVISEDDPVRLVDNVLSSVDWSSWESQYEGIGKRGQPPIHPQIVASALLYGLCRGIRSSRKLEEATVYRNDFIWLVHGRRIDYTTFCRFRTRFKEPLKDLFKQLGQIAMRLGLIKLCEVSFDGTRVKANNHRDRTYTEQSIEKQLKTLEEQYDQMMNECQAADESEGISPHDDHDDDNSPTKLPKALRGVENRKKKLEVAFEQVKRLNEAKLKKGRKPNAQIPIEDMDARIMPGKDGLYGPHYTPTVTTDGECGFIVDCEVMNHVNETSQAVTSTDRIMSHFGQYPEKFLTDGGNISGQVMVEMEERKIAFYAPIKANYPTDDHPAYRKNPSDPVEDLDCLPRHVKEKKFDKSNFIYDASSDSYYCPQGKTLKLHSHKSVTRSGLKSTQKIYRCHDCQECSCRESCLTKNNTQGRMVIREKYDEVRKRTIERMSMDESTYHRRAHMVETVFGVVKQVMGIRQFLLRGLENVQAEWTWACAAYNLKKIVNRIGIQT